VGLLFLLAINFTSSSASVIPTISISSVASDASVAIRAHNFPANRTFTVRMGEIGTRGVGGIVVGTTNSGNGGSFDLAYDIPDALKGRAQIAIRLESMTGGYYSYNWFHNKVGGIGGATPPSGPIYAGIPTFSVQSALANESVTIVTSNFPPNQTFTVTIGQMFTQGIGGTVVGTIESGAGGRATHTFTIPEGLRGQPRLSIRAQTAHVAPAKPYYAYNWFNNSAPAAVAPGPVTAAPDPAPAVGIGGGDPLYSGIPTFRICSITRDGSVTIQTSNFPRNQNFNVTMGAMYTRGIGGTQVGVLQSGADRSARYTFNIPDNLKQSSRISIRAESGHANPYFAYNWFDNFTTTTDLCN
jgi:hypothetical protein